MSKVKKKLDEIHIDLYGLHYLLSLLDKIYTAILLDANMQKLWVVYLQSKNKFMDIF